MLLVTSRAALAQDWLYTVRPGDKLWNLAAEFCGSSSRWRDLARHNALTDPARLNPGSRLRIPIRWLAQQPASARVMAAQGEVNSREAGSDDLRAVAVGDELGIGAHLLTGSDSYATVAFADNSRLQIGPAAEVVFDRLSNYGATGMVDTRVRITRGAAESRVTPQRGAGSVYRIGTPLGVAAVRGTEFRTRAGRDASFVETLGGAVRFDAASAQRDLQRGDGLKATPDGVQVETLLAAPALNSAARTLGTYDALTWPPLSGAVSYAVQLYDPATPDAVLASFSVQQPELALSAVNPASYSIGVSGVAGSGLQGFEARAPITVVAEFPAPARLRVRRKLRQPTLAVSWQPVQGADGYRVTVTSGGGAVHHDVSDTHLSLDQLPPDTYAVQVAARSGTEFSSPTPVVERTIRPPANWPLWAVSLLTVLAIAL